MCSIAKRTSCWKSWQTPRWTATASQHMELLTTVPLLIIDDLRMKRLPLTAAGELLEIIMRRYEQEASSLITSSRPVEDWGELLDDSALSPPCWIGCCTSGPPAQMRTAQLANKNR